MNKTFKVVFNKARGSLMVANEITQSVQKKGTKTIVATAVALALTSATALAETNGVYWNSDSVPTQSYVDLHNASVAEVPNNIYGIKVGSSASGVAIGSLSTLQTSYNLTVILTHSLRTTPLSAKRFSVFLVKSLVLSVAQIHLSVVTI